MSRWLLASAAALFVALLVWLTLESAPPNPPTGVEHSAADAERACRLAVRDTLRDPSFPFTADAAYLGDARYHLSGTVDEPSSAGPVRRNYDCWVHYLDSGAYRTDSLTLWQSH